MGLHRNARLGLAGRRALVADVEAGCSCREAARRRGVSPTTACKWWRRWSEARWSSDVACVSRGSLVAAASLPRLLPAAEQARICAARRRSGWGPRLIAGETGHPHATVWRALRRAGISRPPRQPREQPRRYEWPCPGDLLHIDSKRFVRFTGPATQSPVTATAPAPRSGCGSATNGCTRSSTTTPATPTASSTATSGPRPSPASSSAASPPSPATGSSRSG